MQEFRRKLVAYATELDSVIQNIEPKITGELDTIDSLLNTVKDELEKKKEAYVGIYADVEHVQKNIKEQEKKRDEYNTALQELEKQTTKHPAQTTKKPSKIEKELKKRAKEITEEVIKIKKYNLQEKYTKTQIKIDELYKQKGDLEQKRAEVGQINQRLDSIYASIDEASSKRDTLSRISKKIKESVKKIEKKRDPIIKALNEYEFFYWGEPADSSTYNDLVRRINEQKEDVAELNKKIELMSSLKIKSMDDAIKHVVPIYTSTIGECMEPCKDLNKKLEGTLTDLVTYVKNPASPLREIVSDQKYRALKEV